MKKLSILLLIILVTLSMIGCSSKDDHSTISIENAATELVGQNYQTVVSGLKASGFTNIKTVPIEDLIIGWLTEDGEVEEVAINGKNDFSIGSKFPKDAEVLVSYHTFPPKEEGTSKNDNNEGKIDSESDANHKEAAENLPEKIITKSNNKAFSKALKSSDDSIASLFANENLGGIIKFDANVAYMDTHDNYKTRFDLLIYQGNYNKDKGAGPKFKIEDANYYELNITKPNESDSIMMGDNIRLTARILEFNDSTGICLIEPVNIEMK